MIATALRALYSGDAIIVARVQLEKAHDRQRDIWTRIIQILSELDGAIDFAED